MIKNSIMLFFYFIFNYQNKIRILCYVVSLSVSWIVWYKLRKVVVFEPKYCRVCLKEKGEMYLFLFPKMQFFWKTTMGFKCSKGTKVITDSLIMKRRNIQHLSKTIKFLRNETWKREKKGKERGLRNFKTETDLD